MCDKSIQNPADCFLRKIHKLRSGLRWWQRGFTYLDTIGVTNTHTGLIDVRRFDDMQNATVLLVDNWRKLTGLTVRFEGSSYPVSGDQISAIEVVA